MRALIVIVAGLVLTGCGREGAKPANPNGNAAAPPKDDRPVIQVAADGFPFGHDTPEGAATDLARSFVMRDVGLFQSACIPPFGAGQAREKYEAFRKEVIQEFETVKTRKPVKGDPEKLGVVFAARRLTAQGPVSLGFAAHDFQDIMFVDVGIFQIGGTRFLQRTLVIQDSDAQWYAHPDPLSDPLLSMGLNDESDSTTVFTNVYRVKK